MADKKLPRDELEALRWFRERLRHLGREHPALKTTEGEGTAYRAISRSRP